MVERVDLYMPAEVAEIFGVSVNTVDRWAQHGRLPFIRTLGGHRRYVAAAVDELAKVHHDRVSGRQRAPSMAGGDGRGAGPLPPSPGADPASAPTPTPDGRSP